MISRLSILFLLMTLITFSSRSQVTKEEPKYVYYKIKEGDTFYSIAKSHGISVETLKSNNPNLQFREGWVLRWPYVSPKALQANVTPKASTSPQIRKSAPVRTLTPNLLAIKELFGKVKKEDPNKNFRMDGERFTIRCDRGLYTIANRVEREGLELEEILYFQDLAYADLTKCDCLTLSNRVSGETTRLRVNPDYNPNVDASALEFKTSVHHGTAYLNTSSEYVLVRGYKKAWPEGVQKYKDVIGYFDISFVVSPYASAGYPDFGANPADNGIKMNKAGFFNMIYPDEPGYREYQRYLGSYKTRIALQH
jgi:hypothetical protein